MRKTQYLKIILASGLFFLPFLMSPSMVNSQFLMEDEEPVFDEKKEPVKKKKKEPSYEAYNIKAQEIPDVPDAILLTWDVKSGFKGKFIVGRSTVVPDSKERALAATTVKVISSKERGIWVDGNLEPGEYFYVIVAASRAEKKQFDLKEEVNYTTKSITIKKTKKPGKVKEITDIRARLIGDDVIIVSWDKLSEKGHTYTVYRSTSVLDSPERLDKAQKIAKLSDESQYIDQNIVRGGTYFYAVTFKYLNGKEVRTLKPSYTYITTGIYAKPLPKKTKSEPYRIINIRAALSEGKVNVAWDFSGKTGNKYMRLYRTGRVLKDVKGVNKANVIADVDITQGKYTDKKPLKGKYYYGITPYAGEDSKGVSIISGINIIRNPVTIGAGVKKQVVKKEEPDIKERDEKIEEPDKHIFEDKIPLVIDPDKDKIPENPEDDYREPGDINKIIKRTFFKERFRDAIKELQAAVEATDNKKERALGQLFIGRSYIELGMYRKAVKVLVGRDVTSIYPRETAFWWEYATLRLK